MILVCGGGGIAGKKGITMSAKSKDFIPLDLCGFISSKAILCALT